MFLTIPEAAKELKVHDNTIRNLIKRGDLKAIQAGRQWRIDSDELKKVSGKKIKIAESALLTAGYSANETAQILSILNEVI
jgi:excisionase family DNA binding protein